MLSSRVSADWRRIWRTGVSRGMDRLAVSARFPRDVTGSPALALGTGCSPGDPLCTGTESPKSAPQRASGSPVQPCGLVCEVMACRSGHTGRGLVGLGLCSAFPARPQDRYTVFRLTPRSLEISAALTSLSRSSWLAQGPVTADLAPAWSTAVTVPCTLTTAAVAVGPSRVGPPQGESGVPDLAVPGTGEMTVGGVSIAPARRFVLGAARPAGQLPHRVPVELHPGTRGTAALHIECSFPWGCGAAARNRSIPRTADGQYQLVGPHPAVSGADGSSAAQPLMPATGPPGCLCGTSGSAHPDRPR